MTDSTDTSTPVQKLAGALSVQVYTTLTAAQLEIALTTALEQEGLVVGEQQGA